MLLTLWIVVMVLILPYAFMLMIRKTKEYKDHQREDAVADWLAEHDY